MKKTLLLLLCFPFLVSWQQNDLTKLSGKVSLPEGATLSNLSFRGIDTTFHVTPDTKGTYRLEFKARKSPFYSVIGTLLMPQVEGKKKRQKVQFASPVYIQSHTESHIDMSVEEFLILSLESNEPNNKAIQECKDAFRQITQRTFTFTPQPDKLVEAAQKPVTVAKEIIDRLRPNDEVKGYLVSWAQLEYINVVNAAQRNYKYSGQQLPADIYSHIPELPQIVDYPYWRSLGSGCPFRIAEYIQQHAKTPEEQVKFLKETFSTPSIVDDQLHIIVSTFLFNFPYTPEDLKRLEKITEGMHDRDHILENYKKTRFKPTHKGTGTGAGTGTKGTGTKGTGTGTKGTGAGTGTAAGTGTGTRR